MLKDPTQAGIIKGKNNWHNLEIVIVEQCKDGLLRNRDGIIIIIQFDGVEN